MTHEGGNGNWNEYKKSVLWWTMQEITTMIKYNCQENETGTNLDSHSVVAVF